MVDYTKEDAAAMFLKWRLSKTVLDFQTYFELSKADYIKIMQLLDKEA